MTNNKPEVKRKPKWVSSRLTVNLSEQHAEMLKALVIEEQSADSRSTITTTIAKAIERLYSSPTK